MHRQCADDDGRDECQRAVDGNRVEPSLRPRGAGARKKLKAGFRRRSAHGRSPRQHVRDMEDRRPAGGCNMLTKIATMALSRSQVSVKAFCRTGSRENILWPYLGRIGPIRHRLEPAFHPDVSQALRCPIAKAARWPAISSGSNGGPVKAPSVSGAFAGCPPRPSAAS